MKALRASLFVTTFDMPRHLELVLAGLERQSMSDFELILCDDGSAAETGELIQKFQKTVPFPVIHVWQEHQGFRKCRILNEGLRRARGETMVFLDGDCVPHRDFMRDHVEQQEPGRYLAGRRVELGPKISATLTPHEVRSGYFDHPRPSLIWSGIRGDSQFIQRSLRVGSALLRRRLGMDRVVDLKGCNYSVSRSDLEAINGFDEDYEGYGREDTDVELRLQHHGLKIKSLKGLAIQFHVWHPRREFTPKNDDRLEQLLKSGRSRCSNGLRPPEH
jgi:glycosyltransferase involved in cell wall biosynthesis